MLPTPQYGQYSSTETTSCIADHHAVEILRITLRLCEALKPAFRAAFKIFVIRRGPIKSRCNGTPVQVRPMRRPVIKVVDFLRMPQCPAAGKRAGWLAAAVVGRGRRIAIACGCA